MQRWNLPVASSSAKTCFVALPDHLAWVARRLGRSQDATVPLKLDWLEEATGEERCAYVGWRGAVSGQSGARAVYVTGSGHLASGGGAGGEVVRPGDHALEVPWALAAALGLAQGGGGGSSGGSGEGSSCGSRLVGGGGLGWLVVTVGVVASPPPRASRVEVQPCTVDDWEVVEAQASEVEAGFLAQCQLVALGMVVPLFLHGDTALVGMQAVALHMQASNGKQ